MKRISLTAFSFFFMVTAFIVMGLAYSYIFGINILSLIIPSTPEPQPISLYPRLFVLIDIVLPISYLFGSLCFILISLRDVFAGRCHYGIRPEIALSAVLLLVLGFTLQMLADRVQPASSINLRKIELCCNYRWKV